MTERTERAGSASETQMAPVRSLTPDEKLDAILAKLHKVSPKGNGGFTAACPAHEDRTPSFDIGLGDKGIVFNCHRGCDPNRIVAALGCTWQDFFTDDGQARKVRRRDWRAVELEAGACAIRLQNEPHVLQRLRFRRGWAAKALEMLDVGWDGERLTLPVRDKEGKLHDVLRYDPFAATGRYKVLASKGKSRLPWPSPENVNTEVLFLVEGEGTAISMLSVGLRAVALPGAISLPTTSVARPGSWRGVGWHKTWARRFEKYRHVLILPDCNGPGRALAAAARYDLQRQNVRADIIDLAPKVHDGSDVADLLLRQAVDGESRRRARDVLREIVAEQAEVLVA